MIWIRLFTFSVTPPTLLHSVFTQNFQRLGLLWLGVNETGLTPLGEPMPKFFSGSDLVFFCRGWGGYLQGSFISIFTALWYHCYTHLNDLISWPLYVYYEKTAQKICVPSKMNMYPQMETPGGTCTPKQKYEWACCCIERITMARIRLHVCAAWSAPLLFACNHVMSKCIYCYKCVSDKKVTLKKIMCVYTWYRSICVVMSVHVVLVMLSLSWLIALAL